jgi:hypothetical protein
LRSLKATALAMAERLKKSGAASKYRAGQFDMEADRALSIQVAVETPKDELSLAIQTEDGALTRLLVPTKTAVELATEILRIKSQLAPGSAPPPKH